MAEGRFLSLYDMFKVVHGSLLLILSLEHKNAVQGTELEYKISCQHSLE